MEIIQARMILVFDLNTIVQHFRDGKGLGLTDEDSAFVSAVCHVVEPKQPLSITTIKNTIRKVQGLADGDIFVNRLLKITEGMPDIRNQLAKKL